MKPSALIISDLHARDDIPLCRTDDFMSVFFEKCRIIKSICEKYNIPLLIAGDIFDKAKPSPGLIKLVLDNLPNFIAIPGNHDIPNHNMDLYDKSGLAVLEASGKCIVANKNQLRIINPGQYWDGQNDWVVAAFPYGLDITKPRRVPKNKRIICMTHQMVIREDDQTFGKNFTQNIDLLKAHPYYDLIASGDNHRCFTKEYNGKLLINQGGISRQTADRKEHQPVLFLWYCENNSFEEIPIPIIIDSVSVKHIDEKNVKESIANDYIDNIKNSKHIGIDFIKNMKDHLNINDVEKNVSDIILEGLE